MLHGRASFTLAVSPTRSAPDHSADCQHVEVRSNAFHADAEPEQRLNVRVDFEPPPAAAVSLKDQSSALPQKQAFL